MVTIAAFGDHPHGEQAEQYIISALRAAGALSLSLVAEIDGRVVGHVAFSPVTISEGSRGWYGLGPVSVLPDHQKQGIGKSLIREGLRLLKERGSKGCVLVGDPGYCRRLGFRNIPDLTLEGVPPENLLALPFGEEAVRGAVTFHGGFAAASRGGRSRRADPIPGTP